jgi:hypothetical protein
VTCCSDILVGSFNGFSRGCWRVRSIVRFRHGGGVDIAAVVLMSLGDEADATAPSSPHA